MSDRRHWPIVKSSVESGDALAGCRDNDTKTYRLFVHKGHKDSSSGGFQIDDCMCADLSIEDLRNLALVINSAIAIHEPWTSDEEVS